MTDGICPFARFVPGVTSFNEGNVDRVGFADHTAGGFLSTLAAASFWNGAGVSTHFAIGRKGEILQMVNIFDTAWAEGRDARGQSVSATSPGVTWPPFDGRNPNGLLISTEHEDAETVNGQTHFITSSEWTEAQYQADLKVKRWCIDEVQRVMGVDVMRYGIDSLAGHHMFDPVNRKECPGAYWRNKGRNRLWDDLGGVPDMAETPPRVWLYGNEAAGEELVGNQIFIWHRGITIDKIGDVEGKFPGQRQHNEGGVFVIKEP